MCQRSIRAAGLASRDVDMTCLHCEPSHGGSQLIAGAYQATLDAFRDNPGFDGLVISSDFEAQGVTDAIMTLPRESWAELTVVALLNKESTLHARIPMTALIADGYACGMALADMIHEQISTGGNCISGKLMSCHQVAWR